MDPVTHFEIPAKNLDDAERFYRSVFGWRFQSVPELDYVMVSTAPVDEDQFPTTPGTINGGVVAPTAPGAQHPLVVVAVEDIEAKMRQVEDAGGRIVHGIQDIGDFGRYARVTDPEGHVIALYQAVQADES